MRQHWRTTSAGVAAMDTCRQGRREGEAGGRGRARGAALRAEFGGQGAWTGRRPGWVSTNLALGVLPRHLQQQQHSIAQHSTAQHSTAQHSHGRVTRGEGCQ